MILHFNPQKIRVVIIILILYQLPVFSQISNDSYVELGKNAVSSGIYSSVATQFSGKFGNFGATAGTSLLFSVAKENTLDALYLKADYDIPAFGTSVNLGAFYLWKPFSFDLNETSTGLIAQYRANRFDYQLGLHTRFYRFTHSAIEKYGFSANESTRIWEKLNLMYRFTYFQPMGEKWELEARITNFDYFTILQETNPMISTKISYRLSPKMRIYTDLTYMQAGLLNIRVNYFGFYGRGGVQWQLN